jgi:chaperone LolA
MKHTITIALFVLAAQVAFAFMIDAREIIENVQDRYEDIDDAVISFTRITRFRVSKAEQEVRGTLYYKKTNRYRIETPDRTIVTDGKTSWSYDPVNKQVVIDTYKEETHGLSPQQLLLSYPENYYSTLVGEESVDGRDAYVLKLTPKDESSFTRTMKLWIGKDWLIWRVQITDINGGTSEYRISKIATNEGVSDARFTFNAPAGTEEIDLR